MGHSYAAHLTRSTSKLPWDLAGGDSWDGTLFSGHLFVFVSRRGDRVKILSWDRGGLALWYKRLEKGRFRLPRIREGSKSVQMDSGELSMLLEGIDYSRVRRPRRWEPPSRKAGHQKNATRSDRAVISV